MNERIKSIFFSSLLTIVLAISGYTAIGVSQAYAAGGSSMGGSSGMSVPRKTPQQIAVANYNAGIKHREKAQKLEAQLAAMEPGKARTKVERKVTKEYKKAVKRFRSAVNKVSSFYQAHGSLGYSLKQLGDFEGAMAAYDEAIRLRPHYTPAIEYRAEAYLALQRYDEVIESHTMLARFDPDHRDELEVAIVKWLEDHDRNEANQSFYDWATTITGS